MKSVLKAVILTFKTDKERCIHANHCASLKDNVRVFLCPHGRGSGSLNHPLSDTARHSLHMICYVSYFCFIIQSSRKYLQRTNHDPPARLDIVKLL